MTGSTIWYVLTQALDMATHLGLIVNYMAFDYASVTSMIILYFVMYSCYCIVQVTCLSDTECQQLDFKTSKVLERGCNACYMYALFALVSISLHL